MHVNDQRPERDLFTPASRPTSRIVQGVAEIRCADRRRLLEVMDEDYRYLLRQPGFLSARLVEAEGNPDLYFHITEWVSAEDFAPVMSDPKVLEIFGRLPAEARINSSVCRPALIANHEIGVAALGSEPDTATAGGKT